MIDLFTIQIISIMLIDDYVVLEVLTATTEPELEAFFHHSQISTRRRRKRGSFTFSPKFFFSESYTRKVIITLSRDRCEQTICAEFTTHFFLLQSSGTWWLYLGITMENTFISTECV